MAGDPSAVATTMSSSPSPSTSPAERAVLVALKAGVRIKTELPVVPLPDRTRTDVPYDIAMSSPVLDVVIFASLMPVIAVVVAHPDG